MNTITSVLCSSSCSRKRKKKIQKVEKVQQHMTRRPLCHHFVEGEGTVTSTKQSQKTLNCSSKGNYFPPGFCTQCKKKRLKHSALYPSKDTGLINPFAHRWVSRNKIFFKIVQQRMSYNMSPYLSSLFCWPVLSSGD